MLQIQLGDFSGDNREVSKSIGNFVSKSCDIYGSNSLLSPSFLLNYDPSLLNKNYVYVPAWGRYYYITSPLAMISGGRCIIQCQEDVLMTFGNEIRNLDCYIIRNENTRNKYLVDDFYPAEILSTVTTLKFNATPFNVTLGDSNIVMCVYGGNSKQVSSTKL